MEAEILGQAASADYSLWGLYQRSTLTVKLVMAALVFASFWAWAVIIQKHIVFGQMRREYASFSRVFWSGEALERLFERVGTNPPGPTARVFSAGMEEWRRSHSPNGGLIPGASSRIEKAMNLAIDQEAVSLDQGLPLLATIGSIAPFVGLFGTVWGIMNAFVDIAERQSTNLAVVAPGIAEALLATGLGLLAAIPAVVFYNKLSSDSDRIVQNYEKFSDEFSAIIGRQLEA